MRGRLVAIVDHYRRPRVLGLDLLRIVASLTIILYHGDPMALFGRNEVGLIFHTDGYLAVDIFFVLSGWLLTRQALPTLDRSKYAPASGVARGGYVLSDAANGKPDVILIGTGSEVALCIAAQDLLQSQDIAARVVSIPSWELFDEQDESYRESVLPAAVKARVSVEAASTLGWERYAGNGGAMIGMHGFGASAPAKDLMKHFGFTAENVAAAAKAQVAKWKAA